MIYFTAHTINYVCHCIRTMFRVLGVYITLPTVWIIFREKCWFYTSCKVIYTKYSKHCPYTVAHTFDCVCSKINNS